MMDHFRRGMLMNVGIISGSIIAFWLVLYGIGFQIRESSRDIAASRELIVQRSFVLDNLADLRRTAPEAARIGAKIRALLPLQDELLGFPRFLDGLSRAHNISLSFSFQGDPVPGGETQAGYINFTLRISGKRADVSDFLETIERKTTQFVVNIEGIEFVATGEGEYRADLSGRVFFRP